MLLGVLLFNWFGHRLILCYLQDKARYEQEARLDVNDYNESDLISVKIPIRHLSYYNTSPVFERVDGSMEVAGIQYTYVKRRLFNDSLELLCLPDHAAMKWQTAKRHAAHAPVLRTQEEDPYVVAPAFALHAPAHRPALSGIYHPDFIPFPFSSAAERPPDPAS